MRIEQFDLLADTDSLRACHQISLACSACDTPWLPALSFTAFKGNWQGWGSDDLREAWVARDDAGDPVGCGVLRLPQKDNPTVAFCDLMIMPDRRRVGAGSALLAHCAGRARQAGRSRLSGSAPDGTAGERFARAQGSSAGIDEVLRTMEVDASLPARLSALRVDAEQHAAGYELLSWQAPTPDEHLGELAELQKIIADAPRDQGIEPQAWDTDRIRQTEEAVLARGVRYYMVVARHVASGRLAALTEMATDPQTPSWGFQQLTSVRREHRGHRLGLLVKIAMLELLAEREPAVRRIFTGNAGANDHMIAINEMLGYRAAAVLRSWELGLARI
ncbi:MAG TPA: GNAT family N-acetyltransferase [Streptosporangiaceae bacterium]|jgi:GNAT superfamily N-acetyltransferase